MKFRSSWAYNPLVLNRIVKKERVVYIETTVAVLYVYRIDILLGHPDACSWDISPNQDGVVSHGWSYGICLSVGLVQRIDTHIRLVELTKSCPARMRHIRREMVLDFVGHVA